jgi:hypothetical protein
MPVIGVNDETVGRVEAVVRDKRSGELALVVRTDAGEHLALAVGQVKEVDLQLRLLKALGRDELQQRIAAYRPDNFAPVANDAELASLQAQPSA